MWQYVESRWLVLIEFRSCSLLAAGCLELEMAFLPSFRFRNILVIGSNSGIEDLVLSLSPILRLMFLSVPLYSSLWFLNIYLSSENGAEESTGRHEY